MSIPYNERTPEMDQEIMFYSFCELNAGRLEEFDGLDDLEFASNYDLGMIKNVRPNWKTSIFQCIVASTGLRLSKKLFLLSWWLIPSRRFTFRTDILGAKIIGARTILLERNSKKVVENDPRIPTDTMIPSLDDMINLSMFD